MMDEENEIEDLAPWLLIPITLLGGWLRVFLTGTRGLWGYETFSVWLADHSIADMLPWIIKLDQHPPLYYLLLHYWMALNGNTPYSLRLLSVLFGAGTIPVIYLIGKRMSGVVAGLAAALILTLSPINIRFTQETHMYTLLTFNAAVTIYALVRLLTDSRSARPIGSQFREYLHVWRTSSPVEPSTQGIFSYKNDPRILTGWRAWVSRHRWLHLQSIETDLAWVTFIVFAAATLLSHNMAVLFLLTANIFIFGLMFFQRKKESGSESSFHAPSFWNWVKAQIGILLLCSPWVFPYVQQIGRVYQEFIIPTPDQVTVIQVLKSFLNDFLPGQTNLVILLWILYAFVLCLGLVHYWKKKSRFLFLAFLIAIPFLSEQIISLRQPIFSAQNLLWTTIPLFLILGAGIAQLRSRMLIIGVVGILGTVNLFSAGDYYRFSPREDWSNVAGFVANYAQKGDLILFNATWVQIPFEYTFRNYEDQYSLEVVKHGVPVDLFDSGIPEPRMTESDIPRLNSLLSGRQRVWLVYSHDGYADPMGLIPRTLAAEMKLIGERDFNDVKVQVYVAP